MSRKEKALEAGQFDSPFLAIVLYLYRYRNICDGDYSCENEAERRNDWIEVGAFFFSSPSSNYAISTDDKTNNVPVVKVHPAYFVNLGFYL